MSLYNAPSGEFTPYVKYNAKAGRWYVKDGDSEREVPNPVFVADLGGVRKAWMNFREGQAPDIVFFENINDNVPAPSENHKLGLSLKLFSQNAFGGVVKLESNSQNTCSAISDLYGLYEESPESKKGKLPVVKVTGAEPIKGNYGTNYKPTFEIEKWVDRPAEFDQEGEEASPAPAQPAAQEESVSEF